MVIPNAYYRLKSDAATEQTCLKISLLVDKLYWFCQNFFVAALARTRRALNPRWGKKKEGREEDEEMLSIQE